MDMSGLSRRTITDPQLMRFSSEPGVCRGERLRTAETQTGIMDGQTSPAARLGSPVWKIIQRVDG
jgi:hypothetical protein